MSSREDIIKHLDWFTLLLFLLIVFVGWLNIYAAVYDETQVQSIFSLSINSGKQFVWILVSLLALIIIMLFDFKIFETVSYIIYGVIIVLLLVVLVLGKEISGAKSWLDLGFFNFQPSELAKFATALALAKYLNDPGKRLDRFRVQVPVAMIILLPMGLIVLQRDLGTALVFTSLIVVLFREGMSPVILILGFVGALLFILTLLIENKLFLYLPIAGLALLVIGLGAKTFKRISMVVAGAVLLTGFIFSVDYAFTNLLKPYQQNRIRVLLNPEVDPLGDGWNITQSKIAIGSGGIYGKGFLNGTQTKFDFVPEQSTDFIFCTIGEEHGMIGSVILIALFVVLLLRIIKIAERQKLRFARVYGYSVAAIIFFHFAVNIGMTIGLFPVIGIPLPFFSYGGSSLLGFTVLLGVFLKLDAHRMQLLLR